MTDLPRRVSDSMTNNSRVLILVLVLVLALVGAGMVFLEQDTSLDQFLGESEALDASQEITENFVVAGAENQTMVQLIRHGTDGEDVLTRESLVESLELQQEIRAHPEIEATLPEPPDPPPEADPTLAAESGMTMAGVGNLLALYELNRTIPVTGLNVTAELELSRLAEYDDVSDVPLSEIGIEGFDDIPGDFGDPDDPFDAIEGIDTLEEFLEAFDSLGEVPLGRLRPSAFGFRDVDTLPPGDCLAAFDDPGEVFVPPLSCQIWALEEMDETAFEHAVGAVLSADGEIEALSLLPRDYEPGSTHASAHMMVVAQLAEDGGLGAAEGFADEVVTGQETMRTLAGDQSGDYHVFGLGLVADEIDRSLGDSLALVSPIALVFVVVVLSVAYRDPLDILLGALGIVVTLVWTFGFMGWAGIDVNQIMIAVPVLLIGLGIDFAIHVVMRYRERRGGAGSVRRAMAVALAGVGVALLWVTVTTSIGFLSNLISDLPPLREFGVVSAVGVVGALIVFAGLMPLVKVELDELLSARGIDRERSAFGTGETRLASALSSGARAARVAPVVVVGVALLLTLAGAYGASQVDTSFEEEDFLADDPPRFTGYLPGPMAPGEYHMKDSLSFIKENYQQVSRQGELLIHGNITHDEALTWMAAARENATEHDAVYVLPNDEHDIRSPLSVMHRTAKVNESFARSFERASVDGIPRENVSALYDEVLTRNPAAAQVVSRSDEGEYRAALIQIGIAGDASIEDAADSVRELAAAVEAASDSELTVVATGDPVIYDEVERGIMETVMDSLLITLVAVFLFLTVAYHLTGSYASLGIVTLLPVVLALSWILGTMWALDISFNALTATITALTIGLGIDYNIHVSDRYQLELEAQENVWDALRTTVTGTGGALVGTAVTTSGGFATLVFAILPALWQFGVVTGLTIIYTFLGSLLVLPAMLVLWTRYIGPSEYFGDVADVVED